MRPLIPAGEDNNKMVLCIVLKPDCAIPARNNSVKETKNHGDQDTASTREAMIRDPATNKRP